jgi:RNA polymerase sigma factor (sigma-70 family)
LESKKSAFQLNTKLFCRGDNEALARLYKQLLPQLYLIAVNYTKSSQDAEDIVADCFEKLILMSNEKRQEKFIDNKVDIQALLILIVKNKCLDHIKTTKNRIRILDSIKILWPSSTPNLAKQKFVEQNFETLTGFLLEKERQILKLNMDGFTHEEISIKMNISGKTVSNILSISRNKIRELWEVFMK